MQMTIQCPSVHLILINLYKCFSLKVKFYDNSMQANPVGLEGERGEGGGKWGMGREVGIGYPPPTPVHPLIYRD